MGAGEFCFEVLVATLGVLGGGVPEFLGDVRPRVALEVWAGGRQLAGSGVLRGTDGPRTLTADVTGQQYIHLAALPTVDGADHDHADWAEPTITCG